PGSQSSRTLMECLLCTSAAWHGPTRTKQDWGIIPRPGRLSRGIVTNNRHVGSVGGGRMPELPADVVARLSVHAGMVLRVVFSSSYRALMFWSYMETLYYSRIQSPVGTLILGVSAKGLVALDFDRGQFPPKMNKSVSWQ